jgi:hypothetical protein
MTGISCLNFLQPDIKAIPMDALDPLASAGLNRFLKIASVRPNQYLQFQKDGYIPGFLCKPANSVMTINNCFIE